MEIREDELTGSDPGRKKSKKRASVSTDESRPKKVARKGVPSDMHYLKNILALRRQIEEVDNVEVKRFVGARDVKIGALIQMVWENPDAIAYVKLGLQYLDVERFGCLSSHGRARRIMYLG